MNDFIIIIPRKIGLPLNFVKVGQAGFNERVLLFEALRAQHLFENVFRFVIAFQFN